MSEKPDLLINTSCEHIAKFIKWRSSLPPGIKVALQSNNFDMHTQHVNCVESLDEFISQCALSDLKFSGTLDFEDYDRYIGNWLYLIRKYFFLI